MDTGQFLLLLILLSLNFRVDRRTQIFIVGPVKFRNLVRSHDNPIVIRSTRGLIRKRIVYLFPYQGVIFQTDVGRGDLLPQGTMIIADERNSFRNA